MVKGKVQEMVSELMGAVISRQVISDQRSVISQFRL